MTDEQRDKFLNDYYTELDRLYGVSTSSVADNKAKAEAIKSLDEGHAKMISAVADETASQAKLIEANARMLEAQAKQDEVKIMRKQGWIRIAVDVAKGVAAFALFKAVYGLESDGGWFNRNKESSRLTSDMTRENLLR